MKTAFFYAVVAFAGIQVVSLVLGYVLPRLLGTAPFDPQAVGEMTALLMPFVVALALVLGYARAKYKARQGS